jgi:hypothetical protein
MQQRSKSSLEKKEVKPDNRLAVLLLIFGVFLVCSNCSSVRAQVDQPRITWAELTLNIDISPGETLSREITFTSDSKLKKVSFETSPELAPFLVVQSANINKVKANKQTPLQLSLSIASNTSSGVYSGTLNVKTRDQSLVLERLTVNINIWGEYTDTTFGFKVSAPFGSGVSRAQDSSALQVLGLISPSQPRPDYGGEIIVFRWFNPRQQTIDTFFDGNQGPNFMNETTAGKENVTVDGRPAVLFKEVTGISTGNILVVPVDPYFLVFQISDDPATFSRMFHSIRILN